jgi:hypothetical protein
MLVGLIANPTSSKDIRRLTMLARVIDVEEKANLVARLLVGLGSKPEIEVLGIRDKAGLLERAVALAGPSAAPVDFVPIDIEGTEDDTRRAAFYLDAHGATALITVGGDGTVRAAAEGWPQAPLVPVAAGTNNAFALTDEPSVIGLGTALAVISGTNSFRPTTALQVSTTEGSALAVIDAVAVRTHWTGAGAIWEPAELVEGLVTTARRTAVGIASVSAAFGPLDAGQVRHLTFGGNETVRAVFGPGLILDVPVKGHRDLRLGGEVELSGEAGMVALDGERRLLADKARVRVVEGPRVLDLEQALRAI